MGRLSALGYAQQLTFRTRAHGEEIVTEVVWDGRRIRTALGDAQSGDLAAVVAAVVDIKAVASLDYPERFFEVEISGIARQRGDRPLDRATVEAYVA